jgi:hypothetical protein
MSASEDALYGVPKHLIPLASDKDALDAAYAHFSARHESQASQLNVMAIKGLFDDASRRSAMVFYGQVKEINEFLEILKRMRAANGQS